MRKFDTTLLFLLSENKILLAEKKRGFGKGKLNGIGGKVEKGETVEQAMIRETQEEINVTPKKYEKVATILSDQYVHDEHQNEIMHIFTAVEYDGTISESDEMKPIWFEIDKIPFEKMFSGDKIWLKKILNNEKFTGKIKFDKDFNLVSYSFENEQKLS